MTAPKRLAEPDLFAMLSDEVAEHPYRTVAIAAGLGYLFGTRLGGPLVSILTTGKGQLLASSLIGSLIERR